jgi:lactate dehydrogenase-like 2-hydroxyacid dehydrogenase
MPYTDPKCALGVTITTSSIGTMIVFFLRVRSLCLEFLQPTPTAMIMRDRPTILIPGSLPNGAVVRIADHFEVVRVDSADPSLITEELAHRIRGIGCGAQVTSQLIDALPNLEIIASLGVGYDGIDVDHASRKGVTVTNTPDVLSEEVADTAIGLLINVVRELPKA